MPDTNVDIAIRARNETGAAIRQAKAELKDLDKVAGTIGASGGGFDIGSALLGGVAGLASSGAVDMLMQTSAAVFDLARQSAGVQALGQSFDQLAAAAGTSGGAMLDALRKASQGTIADADLMLSANKAMMLGVADSANEMAQLLEVAAVRGKAMGLSTAQAFSDLVTGIGRMSPLILDNLGIVTGGEAVFDDYAASLGRTAASLTDVERKQALLDKVISETDLSAIPVANQFERMDAAIQNAKVALGEMFGPAVASIAQQIADATIAATNAMREGAAQETDDRPQRMFKGLAEQLATARAELAQYNQVAGQTDEITAKMLANMGTFSAPTAGEGADQIRARIAALEQEIMALEGVAQMTVQTRAAAWDAATGWDKFAVSANTASGAANNHAAAAERVRAALATLAGQADITGNALKSAWIAAAGALGAGQALAGFQASQKELNALTQEWQYSGLTTEEIEFRKAALVQDTSAEISAQIAAINEVTRVTGGQATAVSGLSKEYDDLKSKVSGVLSSALDVGVGVKASDLLPREDDVNENARRLADIAVNGINNQEWLEEFKAEAPGAWADIMLQVAEGADAKTAAARILRDFEDGLRPDLIDKDTAKARVKRMIMGEQSMAALAAEVAAELATEMNIPLQQAMAAAGAALGVPTTAAGDAAEGVTGGTAPDMTGAGSGAGATFAAGFAASASGEALVGGLVATMATADLSPLTGAGAMAGTQWGLGFTENAGGGLLVASIIVKMAAELPRFKASGASAGTQWGAGFMGTVETGISQPLISLLATLVTPTVQANLAAGATQTTPP